VDVGEFMLRLNAQVTGAAGFTGALTSMEAQIKKEQAALTGLEEKLASAKAKLAETQEGFGGKVNIASVAKQRDMIKALEGKIAGKKDSIADLFKGGAEEAQKLIGKKAALKDILGGKLGSLASAATEAGGPIGALSSKIQGFASIAGKAGAAGVALILAAAIFAVVAAVVAGSIALAHFALVSADAARSMRLLGNAASGGAVEGDELAMVVTDIASRVPLAKDKIAEFGRAMELAHVSGRRMQLALEAVAALESVIPGAGAKVAALAEDWSQLGHRAVLTRTQLEGTGLAIDEVAAALAEKMGGSVAAAKAALASGRVAVNDALDAINRATQKKFGKTLAAQMASLTTQFAKMKENIAGLFDGVDLEPFLAALKSITDLFSQNNVVGRALKQIFTGLFTSIFNAAAKVLPYVKAFFLGMAIVALYAYIGIMKIKNAIVEAFGGTSIGKIFTLERAMYAGMAAAILIGGAIVACAIAVVLLTVAIGSLLFIIALPFLIAIAVIALFIYAVYSVYKAIASIDLGGAAQNLVMSFVNKIKSLIGDVVGAMSSLGSAAADALLSALGIASPSKVAIDAAQNVTGTFASEIDDGKTETRAAFSGMVDPGAATSGSGRAASSGGAGRSVTFNNCTFGEGLTESTLRGWILRFMDETAGEGPEPEFA